MGQRIYLSFVLLFLAGVISSKAQKAEAEAEAEAVARVVVEEGAPLTVQCAVRVEEAPRWRWEGGALPADLAPAPEAADGDRLRARLHAARARLAHQGLYQCGHRPGQRVQVTVLRRTPTGDSSPADGGAATDAAAATGEPSSSSPLALFYYDVGLPFSLNCSMPSLPDVMEYEWKKNGTLLKQVEDLKGRFALEENGMVFRLTERSREDDFGNYTCGARGIAPDALGWEVRGNPVAKLPPNANVVEGQKLKLVCRVLGKPYPRVVWTVRNESAGAAEGNDSGAALPAGGAGGEARVALNRSEQGVADGELVISEAARADAGVYTCTPQLVAGSGVSNARASPAATTLRVKDRYAALWPFLGICAEVLLLCAVILVYEKRRTKPEMDDSDTDNHDQKKS